MWIEVRSSPLPFLKVVLLVVQFLCFVLGCATYTLSSPPTTGLASSGRYYLFFRYCPFFNCLEEPDVSLVQLCYLKPRLPSSLPGVKRSSACFMVHSSLRSLVFWLFSELYSTVRVCWLVTRFSSS